MAGKNFSVEKFMGTMQDVPESDTAWIDIGAIVDNPKNFYPEPDEKALAELMESIQANGLLEPPTVVRDGDVYRLISGHSRISAIRVLHVKNPLEKRWHKVLCRVMPPMTEHQEMSAIIEANRQRVKPGYLLQQEAERLTDAYVQRKEAGEELPGRIRDRVAEKLQVSKTKLANLSVIKNGLKVPGIIRAWKEERIPEAAALEIARMDLDAQYRLLDWMIDKNRKYTINEVRRFKTIWTCCKHNCPETAGLCPNGEEMYRAHYFGGMWNCAGCCKTCLKADSCPTACRYVEKKAEPEPKIVEKNPAINNPRLDWETMTPTFCGRVKALREATGLSRKEFAESIGEYPNTYSAWENASMAGSGAIPRLALAFGVTTDYLYGLTDEPAPKAVPQPEGQLAICGWMPGGTTPGKEPGWCVCLMPLVEKLRPKAMWWDGFSWKFSETGQSVVADPVAWMRLPEYGGSEQDD